MRVNNETEWKAAIDLSGCEEEARELLSDVVEFAISWCELMEAEIGGPFELTVADVARETSQRALKADEMTGGTYALALSLICPHWIHGEELRTWHNLDISPAHGEEMNAKPNAIIDPSTMFIARVPNPYYIEPSEE
jgi:hypothetical protein